jgi:predicted amino acid-binding ACT domain protein
VINAVGQDRVGIVADITGLVIKGKTIIELI